MRGAALLLLSLVACGGRTGLFVEAPEDARAEAGADVQIDSESDAPAESDIDAPRDAHTPLRVCPLRTPVVGSTCPTDANGVLCAYVASEMPTPGGLEDWCCVAGGWVDCTTVAMSSETCAQILCGAGPVECVIGQGAECCVCSADGAVDACGPC